MRRLRFWLVSPLAAALCMVTVFAFAEAALDARQVQKPILTAEYTAGKRNTEKYAIAVQSIAVDEADGKTLIRIETTFSCERAGNPVGLLDAFIIEVKQGDEICKSYYKVGELIESNIFSRIASGATNVLLSKELTAGKDRERFLTISVSAIAENGVDAPKIVEGMFDENGNLRLGRSFLVQSKSTTGKELKQKKEFVAFSDEAGVTIKPEEYPNYAPADKQQVTVMIDEKGDVSKKEVVFEYKPLAKANFNITYQYPDGRQDISTKTIKLGKKINVEAEEKAGYRLADGQDKAVSVVYEENQPPLNVLFELVKDDVAVEYQQTEDVNSRTKPQDGTAPSDASSNSPSPTPEPTARVSETPSPPPNSAQAETIKTDGGDMDGRLKDGDIIIEDDGVRKMYVVTVSLRGENAELVKMKKGTGEAGVRFLLSDDQSMGEMRQAFDLETVTIKDSGDKILVFTFKVKKKAYDTLGYTDMALFKQAFCENVIKAIDFLKSSPLE